VGERGNQNRSLATKQENMGGDVTKRKGGDALGECREGKQGNDPSKARGGEKPQHTEWRKKR